MEEYHLHQMWKSPNGTIRAVLDGTVFRAPIMIDSIKPVVRNWTKPITIARHAYGDVYKCTEFRIPGPGRAELIYTGDDGSRQAATVYNFECAGVLQGQYNKDTSIYSFARSCFNYALESKQDLWFGAKDTISKKYDHTFKDIFQEVYDAEYREKFEAAGITYFYSLIDDIVARVIRSEGGFVWACKNYDGDVMSDMVSTAFGSLAMMTSVLVSPDGNYEYEAAHGTVTRHYYKYLKGEATSTNPMATIFAWSGALKKRGELDSLPALVRFGEALEAASLQTLNDGIMTKDLCGLAEGITPHPGEQRGIHPGHPHPAGSKTGISAASRPLPRNPGGGGFLRLYKAVGLCYNGSRKGGDSMQHHPLPEYPRPALRRDSYENLNGLWQYAITGSAGLPTKWDGDILVPYSPETKASGVGCTLQPGAWLHYHRSFVPPAGTGGRVLLHFGAVDYACAVQVNGHLVGGHRGGYWPFALDITDALNPAGHDRLWVAVQDPTGTGVQARGKQTLRPGGMFYPAQSGIWQTVWLERVPENYITELTVTPDYDARTVTVKAHTSLPGGAANLWAVVRAGGRDHCRGLGQRRGRPGRRGDPAHPGGAFLPVEPGYAVFVRPDRGHHAGRGGAARHRAQLLCPAQVELCAGCPRDHALLPEWQAHPAQRPAGSGLLARGSVHPAQRWGSGAGTADHKKSWASTFCASTPRSSRSAGITTAISWASSSGRTW